MRGRHRVKIGYFRARIGCRRVLPRRRYFRDAAGAAADGGASWAHHRSASPQARLAEGWRSERRPAQPPQRHFRRAALRRSRRQRPAAADRGGGAVDAGGAADRRPAPSAARRCSAPQ
jgi:hypothetical protein